MKKGVAEFFTRKFSFPALGIDLGTANSLVYLKGKGIILNEPTVVAITYKDNRVIAIGHEAKKMLGKTPQNITILRPLKEGVVANYRVTEALIRYFIKKSLGTHFFKPEIMVCIPAGATQVERRAVIGAALSAGARKVYLIDEPLAAAIGSQMPIAEASGNMIVDIGGGAAEIAVIALGGVVAHQSLRVGGSKLDEAIASYLRKNYGLIVGEQTAEEIKITIGSAIEGKGEKTMEIKGRDSLTALPRLINLTSSEVKEAIMPVLHQVVKGIKEVFEETPPEISRDIIDRGMVISGGTSLLANLDRFITQETGVPCFVAPDPLFCVIKGIGVALENIDLYQHSLK
ncbi:rod shape-determining protein [Candidatus Shapirobacteria bacterium]|nr:rod shape-determining protein [Candidatus Shapirobacteria bacterium]